MEQVKQLQLPESLVKKMHCDVDKPLDYNEKSVQLYHAIHEYSKPDTANARYLKCFIAAEIQ